MKLRWPERERSGSATPPAEPRPAREEEAPEPPRLYRVRESATVLAAFAITALALDSEGLVTWARRMELGPVRSGLLATLEPWHRFCDAAGLANVRRGAVAFSDTSARALGAGEDPLFARAWHGSDVAEDEAALDVASHAAVADARTARARTAGPAAAIPANPNAGHSSQDGLPFAPSAGRVAAGVEGAFDSVGAPLELSRAPTHARASEAHPGRQAVLLIGDSMMGGSLGGAITRALAPNPRLRVVQASQNGTGLSRPDVFDWMKVVPPLLEREQPRFVVVSLGANDGQTLRLAGKPIAFGDPLWEKVYRARAVKMMRSLTATGARVLWLGLPPMRNSRFSSRIETLNRLFQQAAQRVSGVEYLELGMVVAGPGGDYSTFATDEDGRLVRMRMEDGIHYSPAGARAVTRWIVDWLRERQLLAAAR